MRARRAAVALSLVLVLAACGVQAENHARVADDENVPFELLDVEVAPATTLPGDEATQAASLCFVLDGRLEIVPVQLAVPVTLMSALAALADPPSDPPSLSTTLADPSLVSRVRLAGGIARVDLGGSIADLASEQQLLLVAQIVCTLTGQPGVGQVSFTLEGSPVDVPTGDGSLTSAPVSRDDYSGLLD